MNRDRTVRYITEAALMIALLSVSSYIVIPFLIPFTLQTFAIFAAVGILGGKRGTLTVLVWLIAGFIGLPLFSGFRGGFAVLFEATGGYLLGFLFAALSVWMLTARKRTAKRLVIGMAVGLFLCYLIGSLWYYFVYASKAEGLGFMSVIITTVIPFILPDVAKLALAFLLSWRVSRVRGFLPINK